MCQLISVTMYCAYVYRLHVQTLKFSIIKKTHVNLETNFINHLLQHAEPCSLMRFMCPAMWQQDVVDFFRAVIGSFGSFTQWLVHFFQYLVLSTKKKINAFLKWKICVTRLHVHVHTPVAKKATGKLCLKFYLSPVKLQACSLTSAPFSPGHGSIPYENSSSTVIPKAHTSEAWENLRNLRTSCGHLKRSTHTCYHLGISYLQVHNKFLKQAAFNVGH